MNANNIVHFPKEPVDKPIEKPSEPLPAIFSGMRHSGFSTARKVHNMRSIQVKKEAARAATARSN